MDLKWLLLGLLSTKVASGYELHKRILEPIRPSQTQIYRTLSDLAEAGLVSFDKVEQEKLPAKKVYFVTEAGLAELDRWLKNPPEPRLERDSFFFQLMLFHRLDREDVIRNVKAYADEIRCEIEWLRKKAKPKIRRAMKRSGNRAQEFYNEMVVDLGIVQLEARLKWTNEALERISNFTAQP